MTPEMERVFLPFWTGRHPWNGGGQRFYAFENGYGASLISRGKESLEALAVIIFTKPPQRGARSNDWEIVYTSPLTEDVLRGLSEEEVQELLSQIAAFPPGAYPAGHKTETKGDLT